ncbi:putative membrane protein [Escherichia coli 2-427-07_S3_C1]|nr:putative membrane protein [Escherichia coli 2-427-07_S3_C1]KEN81597.1 putative membrane protein [Escherichia coli 2-474-04_S4_C1]
MFWQCYSVDGKTFSSFLTVAECKNIVAVMGYVRFLYFS